MKLKRLRINRILTRTLSWIGDHLLAIFLVVLSLFLIISFLKVKSILTRHQLIPQNSLTFFSSPEDILDSTGGRTNFLILGIRGENTPEVPDLTDTIIVASYSHKQEQLTLLSIPRDLWVNSLKTKINAVYHYGQERQPSIGFQLSNAAILETTGLPIHYNLVVDFQAFTDIINLLEGVEINVPNSFTDDQFPIPGKENVYPTSGRYQTVEFQTGPQTMDGEIALNYIRSRHAEGDEGTDIARSRRQQLIIKAIQQKILTLDFLLNQQNRDDLLQIIQTHIITNVTPDLYPTLARLALKSRSRPINSISLSYEPDENGITLLDVPPSYLYQNQWVLVAHDNNWEAFKQYILNRLNNVQ